MVGSGGGEGQSRDIRIVRKKSYYACSTTQIPPSIAADDKKTGTAAKQDCFTNPAFFIEKVADKKNANMQVTWKKVTSIGMDIDVPVLVSTRPVQKGEALKVLWTEIPEPPAAKKQRIV